MHALTTRSRHRITTRRIAVIASVLVLAGIAVILFFLNQPRKMPRLNPNRKEKVLALPVKDVSYSCLSRDGNWIAFGGPDDKGKWDVYYMNSSGGGVRRVTHDSLGAVVSDISRDGAWILYYRFPPKQGQQIAAVPPLGGTPRALASGFMGKFVGATDRIIYQKVGPGKKQSVKNELWSIKLDGSEDTLIFVDPGFWHLAWGTSVSFYPSPDGKSVAWIKTFPDFSQDIIIHDLKTGAERQVTFNRTQKDEVFWTHNNFIIYSSYANGNYDLWVCPAEGGEPRQLTVSRLNEWQAQLSDDGSKLLYYEGNYSANIKSMDLETGKSTSITSDDQNRVCLCVSPDGRYFAYTSTGGPENMQTFQGIQIIDRTGERPQWSIVIEERMGCNRSWSPDGKWMAYTRRPDSVNKPFKICIVSPFGGTPPKVIAEVKSYHGLDRIQLGWKDDQTLRWFSGMKTWVCSIENPKPQQIFQDSIDAHFIQKGKYVFFRDYRAGRQGYWVDDAASLGKAAGQSAKRILAPIVVRVAPSGQFVLTMSSTGEMQKVSLPDLKTLPLPCRFPRNVTDAFISQDGKSLIYVEQALSTKLMLWENPFVWE